VHSIYDIHSLHDLFEFLRHIDENFSPRGFYGYLIPFLVLFAETGLVVTPFLPGDTLLFTLGLFARPDRHALNIYILLPLLTLAPLCGDSTNFLIGRWFGHRMFSNPKSKIFRRSALDKTHEFFEKHGERTIILARWVAIVRTFAPFVAGMGEMRFTKFIRYSAIGAFFWVWGCMLAGYFFGAMPVVHKNFGYAILAMLLAGAIPISIEILKQRQEIKAREAQEELALEVMDDEGSPLTEA
jgi:membrane-associated protein